MGKIIKGVPKPVFESKGSGRPRVHNYGDMEVGDFMPAPNSKNILIQARRYSREKELNWKFSAGVVDDESDPNFGVFGLWRDK